MVLASDLSTVKIIDFGLSTYLEKEAFQNMPAYFKKIVSGTR